MAQTKSKPKAARTKASPPTGVKVQTQGEMEYERGPGSKFDLEGRGIGRKLGKQASTGQPRRGAGRGPRARTSVR